MVRAFHATALVAATLVVGCDATLGKQEQAVADHVRAHATMSGETKFEKWGPHDLVGEFDDPAIPSAKLIRVVYHQGGLRRDMLFVLDKNDSVVWGSATPGGDNWKAAARALLNR